MSKEKRSLKPLIYFGIFFCIIILLGMGVVWLVKHYPKFEEVPTVSVSFKPIDFCNAMKVKLNDESLTTECAKLQIWDSIDWRSNRPNGSMIFEGGEDGCVFYINEIRMKNMTHPQIVQNLNGTKMSLFYSSHDNYIPVDMLNPITTVEGSIKGDVHGEQPVGVTSEFLVVSTIIVNVPVTYTFKGDVSLIMKTQNPTRFVNESEFGRRLGKQYARCLDMDNMGYQLFRPAVWDITHTRSLVCMFDKDNIQFVTMIDVNDRVLGCVSGVHKKLYVYSGYNREVNPTVNIMTDCSTGEIRLEIEREMY